MIENLDDSIRKDTNSNLQVVIIDEEDSNQESTKPLSLVDRMIGSGQIVKQRIAKAFDFKGTHSSVLLFSSLETFF